jgi:hypothetical protein
MFDTILDVLNGLITAINNLSLTVTNMIQVSCSQSSTCGTSPPQPETVEGEAPPEGYSEYEVSEKCKAANLVVDDLVTLLNQFEANSIEEIAVLGIGALTALFALVVALLPTGPLALAVGVVGTIGGLVAFFLVQTVNLVDFIALIESLREDLVCALYESTDNTSANTDFRDILSGGGATSSALGLLDAINFVNGLSLLFFSKDDISSSWQSRLDGYTAITDCEDCPAPCPNFDGTYHYPCAAMVWCQIDGGGSDWLIRDNDNLLGLPDGLTAYFQKFSAGGSEAGCDGVITFNMWVTLDFGEPLQRPVLQALTRGDATNRLPGIAWSNVDAAFLDFNHASWSNPSGNDTWYNEGAVLVWSQENTGASEPFRYARLKMGGEATDPNGVQLHIDAIRMRPF